MVRYSLSELYEHPEQIEDAKSLAALLLLSRGRRGGAADRTPTEDGRSMRVGVPTEIREEEYRVALTPAGTKELTTRGHEVLVQRGAGEGSLIADEAYVAAGARIVPDAEALFAQAELIVKVKEPLPDEIARLEAAPHPLHVPAPCSGPRADERA